MKRTRRLTLALLFFAFGIINAQENKAPTPIGDVPPTIVPTYQLSSVFPNAKNMINQTIGLKGTASTKLPPGSTGVWIMLIDGTSMVSVEKKFTAEVPSTINGKEVTVYGAFTYNAQKKFVFAATGVTIPPEGGIAPPLPK